MARAKFWRWAILILSIAGRCAATTSSIDKPNVVLITIDTVRADHLGCYGDNEIETPTLDSLAKDGIVFDRAISQVPLTWPSHAAMLTGLYPFQNGVQDFTGQPLSPRFRSVSQAFQQQGYATGAIVSSFVLDRSWGLARGFTSYDDAFTPDAFAGKEIGLVERRAGESVSHALAWLRVNSRHPFFLWLHLYDPHSPYDPPEPYRTRYSSHLYDGEISYADHELGRLIVWLKGSRLYDKTAIVVVSDHGESLGEHGEQEHGFFVYNAAVHVPLIVKLPAGSGIRPHRVSRPVETIAIAPTLLRLAGIHDPIERQFSASDLLARGANDNDAYSETLYPFSSFGWSPLHALETDRYHYVEAPQPELYDLVADPAEKDNLVSKLTATASVMREKLNAKLREHPFLPESDNSSELNPDAREKLRALGYFGFRAPVSADALKNGLADPKDKLNELNLILKAVDAAQQHNEEQAEALLRQVEAQDPALYVVPFLLAESSMRLEKWSDAADQFQGSLKLNPNFDNAMTGLGRALARLGRTEEARRWFQQALQINPQNYRAWYESGLLNAATNPPAAAAEYKKAVAIQPNFFPAQRELGVALIQQKNYSQAATHFEAALALGLNDARLRNYLGICYSRTNRLSKAVEQYKQALQLDPSLADVHLNLGFAYEQLHRSSLAEREYQQACELSADVCRMIQQHRKEKPSSGSR